jgi:tetratricopeptide (TPR) repeat protein
MVNLAPHYCSDRSLPVHRRTGKRYQTGRSVRFGAMRQVQRILEVSFVGGNPHVVQPKYRAFLSYSHRDAKWADWLHKSLESYRTPKRLVGSTTPRGLVAKRLTPIFRDREELASATDLGLVIDDALRESACQIVICSPQSAKSRWVNEEILAFKRLGRENSIFCLIVGGEPNASDQPDHADEECFAPALRFKIAPDGALSDARTEPIAADARPGKDGRQNAKLKLIAGILGVGFDVLRRREQQRRYRQLFVAACAAMFGMIFMSGLAAYALIQRAAAQKQTVRAEAEADAARQTTGFLIGLFRVLDPSEARGNSITAREMLDKGAARIDTELAKQPAIQATLMDTVGTVYMGLGLYTQARPLLERAASTRRRLADTEPAEVSESLNHLADLQTVQADYVAAEKAYREAASLQAAHPKDRRSRIILANSLYGLGLVLYEQGRYKDAERNYRDALTLQHLLYGETHGDIARTLKDLAQAIYSDGDLKSALPLMQEAVAMQRELRGSAPHPDLADAINDLGILVDYSGDYPRAESLYRESISMYRRLFGEKHNKIADGLNNLASVLQEKGDLANSESTYRQAIAMQRELLGEVHPDVANTLNNLAFLQYDRGNTRGALATEREALAIYRKLFPNDHPDVAAVTNKIGFWLTLAGDFEEADRHIQEGLAMRRRLFGDTNPNVASSLENLAILQVSTHQYPEALVSARSAVEIFTSALSASHWKTAIAESAEGAALTGLGDYDEAEKLLMHSYGILSKDAFVSAAFPSLTRGYLDTLHRQQRRAQHEKRTSPADGRAVSGPTIAAAPRP